MLLQGFKIDTQSLSDTRAEVFHHDVRVSDQLIKPRPVGRRLEVDFDAALAAIDQTEIDTFAITKRPQVSAVVTVHGHFEFDDVSAQIREHRGAMGTGKDPANIQDAHALELLSEGTVFHRQCSAGSGHSGLGNHRQVQALLLGGQRVTAGSADFNITVSIGFISHGGILHRAYQRYGASKAHCNLYQPVHTSECK
ncbi:hypothetical protein EMIT0P253_410037 [Pseudomonas sp. IT-P253]